MIPLTPKLGCYEVIQTGRDGRTRSMWQTNFAAFWAKIVCGPCNRWLGRSIEEPAIPALSRMVKPSREGEVNLTIRPPQQRALATWATKVALLYPYVHVDPRHADPQHLADLRAHARPPRGFRVWLGAYAGRGPYFVMDSRHYRLNKLAGWAAEYEVELFTFYAGHALFQVFKGPPRAPYAAASPNPVVGPLVRIWPLSRRNVAWPTPPLDLEAVRLLGRSIPTR